jgi:hypothetical protein
LQLGGLFQKINGFQQLDLARLNKLLSKAQGLKIKTYDGRLWRREEERGGAGGGSN